MRLAFGASAASTGGDDYGPPNKLNPALSPATSEAGSLTMTIFRSAGEPMAIQMVVARWWAGMFACYRIVVSRLYSGIPTLERSQLP